MAVAEVVISIRLAPNQTDGHGIDGDAEVIFDFTSYYRGPTVDDVMASAEYVLEDAREACSRRASQPPTLY